MSVPKIKIAQPEDQRRWDDFVEELKGGPYIFWAWKEAVERAYGHQGYYLLAEEGNEVVGILPLILFRVPFKRPFLVSLPFCDYGGTLVRKKNILPALLKEALSLKESLKARGLEVRFAYRPCDLPSDQNTTEKVRLILELPPQAEDLWKALKSKVRSQVRRPLKEGAEVSVGGLDLLGAFYHIYRENMHFLGSPAHSLAWFKAILHYYGDRAQIVLVHKDNTPLAAGIILFSKDTATVPWASSLRAYKRISPNMLLYWQFLSLAAEKGLNFFDFGRSTPGEGTYRFKKQWGARPFPLYWYQEPPPREDKKPHIRPLLEKTWRKLPKGMVNWLGPRLRGYIAL